MTDTPTRKCTKCGEEKPETSEFFYSARGKLAAHCKACHNGMTRGGYAKRKETPGSEEQRQCVRCGATKPNSEFYVGAAKCKFCRLEDIRKKYPENADTIKTRMKKYYVTNSVGIKEKVREYRENNPEKVKKLAANYYRKNKDLLKTYQVIYRGNNQDYVKNYQMVRRYGITLEEYIDRCITQSQKCAICGVSSISLQIDHDHRNGKVRQLLCRQCNTGLGFFRDDISVITRTIQYLGRDYPVVVNSDRKARPDDADRPRVSQLNNNLRRNYGIDLNAYDEMLAEQNHGCWICGSSASLAVDHDHTNGKIRGILCRLCNGGIAFYRDDVNLMKKAIEYLNTHNDRDR
jgi:hypothetical protein